MKKAVRKAVRGRSTTSFRCETCGGPTRVLRTRRGERGDVLRQRECIKKRCGRRTVTTERRDEDQRWRRAILQAERHETHDDL